jgi:hypothetical protein
MIFETQPFKVGNNIFGAADRLISFVSEYLSGLFRVDGLLLSFELFAMPRLPPLLSAFFLGFPTVLAFFFSLVRSGCGSSSFNHKV